MKEKSSKVRELHCMIHQYAVRSNAKLLLIFLKNVFNSVVKIVIVKNEWHNFKQFYKKVDSDHETLLFYTAVRWLSKENIVARFYELRTEIKLPFQMVKKDAFVDFFSDETWLQALAYLAMYKCYGLVCTIASQYRLSV